MELISKTRPPGLPLADSYPVFVGRVPLLGCTPSLALEELPFDLASKSLSNWFSIFPFYILGGYFLGLELFLSILHESIIITWFNETLSFTTKDPIYQSLRKFRNIPNPSTSSEKFGVTFLLLIIVLLGEYKLSLKPLHLTKSWTPFKNSLTFLIDFIFFPRA